MVCADTKVVNNPRRLKLPNGLAMTIKTMIHNLLITEDNDDDDGDDDDTPEPLGVPGFLDDDHNDDVAVADPILAADEDGDAVVNVKADDNAVDDDVKFNMAENDGKVTVVDGDVDNSGSTVFGLKSLEDVDSLTVSKEDGSAGNTGNCVTIVDDGSGDTTVDDGSGDSASSDSGEGNDTDKGTFITADDCGKMDCEALKNCHSGSATDNTVATSGLTSVSVL